MIVYLFASRALSVGKTLMPPKHKMSPNIIVNERSRRSKHNLRYIFRIALKPLSFVIRKSYRG